MVSEIIDAHPLNPSITCRACYFFALIATVEPCMEFCVDGTHEEVVNCPLQSLCLVLHRYRNESKSGLASPSFFCQISITF